MNGIHFRLIKRSTVTDDESTNDESVGHTHTQIHKQIDQVEESHNETQMN